jgi:hypothetical protein
VRIVTIIAVLSTLATVPARAGEPASRRALVIAFNGSDDPETAPLRYADDDGILWTETLERLGIPTVLLTVPDAETSREASPLLSRAKAPSFEALDAAVEELHAAIAAEHAAGHVTDALVIYVGHDLVDEAGQSYLMLLNGRLDRAAFFERVVDKLGADYVHVVIDACRASESPGVRGADPAVLGALRAGLEKEQLASRPTVGAIFSESEDGETHEWSRIRAGVVSHAMRSALLGAGDVNHDGRIEYSELDAFVAAALAGSVRARRVVHTLPPAQDPRRPLVGPAPEGPQLALRAGKGQARLSVEDDHGLRLADVHRQVSTPINLALPPRDGYWLRSPEGEVRVDRSRLADPPPLTKVDLAQRGPEEQGARDYFSVAFGRPFYDGYIASNELPPASFAESAPTPEVSVSATASVEKSLGLALAVTIARAPLGADKLAPGLRVAWRAWPTGFQLGAALGYDFSPRAFDGGTVHVFSAQALVGWQGQGNVAPYAELSAGWLVLSVARPEGIQGDAGGFGGQAGAGVRFKMGSLALRGGLTAYGGSVRLDGGRTWFWQPGLEVGVEL